ERRHGLVDEDAGAAVGMVAGDDAAGRGGHRGGLWVWGGAGGGGGRGPRWLGGAPAEAGGPPPPPPPPAPGGGGGPGTRCGGAALRARGGGRVAAWARGGASDSRRRSRISASGLASGMAGSLEGVGARFDRSLGVPLDSLHSPLPLDRGAPAPAGPPPPSTRV